MKTLLLCVASLLFTTAALGQGKFDFDSTPTLTARRLRTAVHANDDVPSRLMKLIIDSDVFSSARFSLVQEGELEFLLLRIGCLEIEKGNLACTATVEYFAYSGLTIHATQALPVVYGDMHFAAKALFENFILATKDEAIKQRMDSVFHDLKQVYDSGFSDGLNIASARDPKAGKKPNKKKEAPKPQWQPKPCTGDCA